MDNIFYKPYIENTKEAHFCYSREVLKNRPIYPTYVLDGGGFFFVNDEFGTQNSDEWAEKIMDGSFFEYWTRNGEFDWSAVFKDYIVDNYTPEFEGSIWINRLYILLPLAQKYMITNEDKYAIKWLEIFTSWVKNNPYTDYSDRPKDLIWENMQVSTRIINIVHSLFMLGDCKLFTKNDMQMIYESIRTHGAELIRELKKKAETDAPDNHVLQMADASIMLAVLFPEFFDSEDFINIANKVVKDNIRNSIFADGCNNEDSITYSHFIARLYLECELFLTNNGRKGINGCKESIQKQYDFLYHFASPEGNTLQIGDSYSRSAFDDIDFVNGFYPLSFDRTLKTHIFYPSKMAVLRNKNYSVYVDAMDMVEWHQHFGRPNIIVYYKSTPVVVDSGGTNYDRGIFFKKMHSAGSHNVIDCKDIKLTVAPSIEKLEFVSFDEKDGIQTLVIKNTVSTDGIEFIWLRTLALSEEKLEITDSVTANRKMNFENIIHTKGCRTGYNAFWATLQPVNKDFTELNLRYKSRMATVRTDSPFELSFEPCLDENNKQNYTQVITRKHFAKEFTDRTTVSGREIR